jgi:hypothetical protein
MFMKTTHLLLALGVLSAGFGTAHAQNPYTPYGNGPVVVVPTPNYNAPYSYGAYPNVGSPAVVLPRGNRTGVVVTPNAVVPYGRYNRDAYREGIQVQNAWRGAQANDDAARAAQQPLTPLNPLPGNLR